jgi:chromosome segregation ATPase
VSKVLLTILNETLDDIAEEMRLTQATLEGHQVKIQDLQEELQRATSRQQCTIYEDEQAKQRGEVLRSYLTRLGEYPRVLGGKLKKLTDAQEHTARARDEVDRYITRARTDLQGRQTQLAVAGQRAAELQKWWGEVSELIASFQRPMSPK